MVLSMMLMFSVSPASLRSSGQIGDAERCGIDESVDADRSAVEQDTSPADFGRRPDDRFGGFCSSGADQSGEPEDFALAHVEGNVVHQSGNGEVP